MENLLPLFVALTAVSVLLQAGILIALYLSVRKTSARVESVIEEVRTKVLPPVVSAEAMLNELRPKLQIVTDNMVESTILVRAQVERVDATVNDVVDRARLQVIRADDLLTRTMDRVEQTSDVVHKTVVSPVRQFSGIIQGVTAGLEFLFSGRAHRNGNSREGRRPVQQDEMFI
jgi:methyl-accepting chemotaxis protein